MEQSLQRKVIVIPKRTSLAVTSEGVIKKKRVSAYCRVSTKQEQQLDSLENQTLHFTQLIKKHDDWEFAGIYADEGLSGTMLKKRDEFNRMVADAKAGKFDLILIKSIARYCRNTVDSLKTARELAAHGVVIYFEKENLYSNDPKTELAFTIFSSFAQEESRSISDNVARGYRMKYKTGTAKIREAYGYKRDGNGGLVIVPEEAKIIKRIFQDFLDGYTPQQMAKRFNEENIPRRTDKIWRSSTIQGILQNEKYIGDTKFQKVYTVDFLTHKTVKNNGELESYYIEDTHNGIISKIDFALVQTELKRRNELRGCSETGWTKYSGKYAFSNLLMCGCCGARYRRFGYKNATGWIRTWACQAKEKKEGKCTINYTIPETELENAFNSVLRELVEDNSVLDDLMLNIAESLDKSKVDERLQVLDDEINNCRKKFFELMQANITSIHARKQIDGEIQEIMKKGQAIQDEREAIIGSIERCNLDAHRLSEMKDYISANNPLDNFNELLFRKLIRYVVIHSRDEVEFVFNMGLSRKVLIGTAAK